MKTLSDAEIRLQDTVCDALRPKPDGKMLSFARPAGSAIGPQARKQMIEIEAQLSGILAKAVPDHPALEPARASAAGHLGRFRPDLANARAVAIGVTRNGQARPHVAAEAAPVLKNGVPHFSGNHKRHWPALAALAGDLKTYAKAAGKTGSAKFPPVERLGLRDGRGESLMAYGGALPAKAPRTDMAAAAGALGRINERLDTLAPRDPGFDGLRQHILDTVWTNREALAGWGKIEAQNDAERQKMRERQNIHERDVQPLPFLPNKMHYPMAETWHGINRRQHLENERLSAPVAGLTPEDALSASALIRRHAALEPGAGGEGGVADHQKRIAGGVQRQTAARADAHAGLKGEIAAAMDKVMPAKPGNHAARAGFALAVFERRHGVGRLDDVSAHASNLILPPGISMAMKTHAGSMEALAGSLERLHAAIEGRKPLERAQIPVAADAASGPAAAKPPQNKLQTGKKRPLEGQSQIENFFKRAAPAKEAAPAAAPRGLDERPPGTDRSR